MFNLQNVKPLIKFMPKYDPTDCANIKAITYDGMSIGDKKTKVFAYIGYPERNSDEKIPAIVLVHGGGGHAYFNWVRMWNEIGYAAIAMDTTGYYPKLVNAGINEGDNDNWIHGVNGNLDFAEIGYTDAPDNDHLSTSNNPIDTQWMYHAVADTILAHNILLGDDSIDSDKIGITGISWGGVITSIAIGHDNRYAFAIPIYGAGYLSESVGVASQFCSDDMTKKLWFAENNFHKVSMPVFWFNWNYDIFFSANTTSKSYHDTVKNNQHTIMSLKNNMNHSHYHGWIPKENQLFADSIVKGTIGFPRFLNQPDGKNINCKLYIPDGLNVKANIFYINSPMSYAFQDKNGFTNTWLMEQDWQSYPIEINDDKIIHTIGDNIAGYYIELATEIDGYAHVSSSEYIII